MEKLEDKKVEYVFIDEKSDLYEQSIKLRYDEFYKDFNRTRESIFDEYENESTRIVACIDNNVIGHARLFIDERKNAEITQVVVHRDYRGMNIGAEIMTNLLTFAKKNCVHSVELDARIYAINFYKKLGFKSKGDIFESKKTGLPHIRMEIFL